MRRADRLFRLVQLLRARSLVTAEWLAGELGISKRTVYRDIADLVSSGVPVRGEAGVGYALEKGFELPPLTFTAAEIEALVTGARMVQAWGDPALADAAGTAQTKIEGVLAPMLRRVLRQTAVYAPRWTRDPQADGYMVDLRRAIAERRKVRVAYVRADGEASGRVLRPLGLHFWGRSWSVAAWCELRSDYRSFRPDRIEALQVLDEGFDGEDGITIDAFHRAMEEREGGDPFSG